MDWRCNRYCAASFLLFHTSSPRLAERSEPNRGVSFHANLAFMFFSPLEVKLSRLCEQDKILQELEAKIRSLKDDKVVAPLCVPPYLAAVCSSRRVL